MFNNERFNLLISNTTKTGSLFLVEKYLFQIANILVPNQHRFFIFGIMTDRKLERLPNKFSPCRSISQSY